MKRKSPFSSRPKTKRHKTDADLEVKRNSITFKDEKMEENTNDILPYEILLQIFVILSPKDRSKAAVTCRSWRACWLDDSLGWYQVANKTLRETIRNYEHSKLKAPGLYPTLQRARQANTSDLQFDEDIKLLEAKYAVSYYWVKNNTQYHLVQCDTNFIRDDWNSGTYRHRIRAKQSSLYSSVIEQEFTITIEANMRRIERHVQNGETIGLQDELFRTAANHHSILTASRKDWNSAYLKRKYNPSLSYTPQVNEIVVTQDKRLTGVKLHDYQLRAINFMVFVEQERKERKVSPLVRVPYSFLWTNPLKRCLVLPEDSKEHNLTFTVKGGVLADEMGLGKSMEVLGLILHRPMTQAPEEDKLFVSKATLIFCPNHLVQQWQNEIEKHTEPMLKVLTITTIHHVKKYTPQDVMNADVVIATYNLLQNSNYINYPNGEGEERLDHNHFHIRYNRLDQLLTELKQNKKAEQAKGVILEHYRWHRIVLDEGHEILKDKFFKAMHKFATTHKWFVSGTPFPRMSEDIIKVRQWLDVAIHRPELSEIKLLGNLYDHQYNILQNLVPTDDALSEMFFKEMIWRNTKKSVNVEYEMVAVHEEIKSVTLSPLERAIYTHFMFPSMSKEVRACLCTMNSDWGNNNEERIKYFVAQRKRWIKQVESELEELNTKYEYYKAKLDKRQKTDPNNTTGLGAANDFMRNYPKESESVNKKLSLHKERLALFEKLELDEDNEEGYTTKLRDLVNYLKDLFEQDPAKRVIIFSQYHDFLEQIGRDLTENDILTTNLKGNVYQKTNGLNKFKANKSDVKVMLMSFNKTASGTNLIEASHVIFMEPLNKPANEVAAIESQAIGRAQRQGQTQDVTLVRFLAADTVETKSNKKLKE